jgi:HK97 family phage portal protein
VIWPFRREEKGLPPRTVMAAVPGGAQWQRGRRDSMVVEGYQLNAIVYRAVRLIADACANLTIELHQGEDVIEAHPALDLLARPNPMQSFDAFIRAAFTDWLIYGEMPIFATGEAEPLELWPISPVEIEVEPSRSSRIPLAYVHDTGTGKTWIAVDPITGRSRLYFGKMYNPGNLWRGQSPLMAAALAGDIHNAGLRWNYSLLKNSARPSGIIKFTAQPGMDTIGRLREFFKRQIQGETNAGEIPFLFDGADWVPTDHAPKDMDFLNTLKEMARQIATAYGVPLPLIENDAATFNNMEQAKERLYTDTVIPLFNEFLASFGDWLLSFYGTSDGMVFKLDMDDIPALESQRARKFDRMIAARAANVLTINEVRAEIGYDAVADGDDLDKPAPAFSFPPMSGPPGDDPEEEAKARRLDLAALAYGTLPSR